MTALASTPEPTSGVTADHAPAAKPPDDDGARRPARLRRVALLAAAACATVVAGVGLSARAWTPAPAGCPAGMALIEGATFQMGSAADAETPSDETPLHAVTVRSFCLDVTEVTVGAYAACEACGPAPRTVELEGLTPNGLSFESQFCNGPEALRPPHQLRRLAPGEGLLRRRGQAAARPRPSGSSRRAARRGAPTPGATPRRPARASTRATRSAAGC